MTREEAVAVLEAFIENPLFSNIHKAAFNIAIHDIKQRHDWDINNLILINKENYEPIDREILDKIRDEVCDIDDEIVLNPDSLYERKAYVRFSKVIDIIDKYMAESEDKECTKKR